MKPYYADDSVTLWHGDCLDVLTDLPAAATLALTDPPFGVRKEAWDLFVDLAAFRSFTTEWLSKTAEAAATIALFFPDRYLPLIVGAAGEAGIPYRRSLLWRKPPGSQMAGASCDGFWYDFEQIFVFGVGATQASPTPLFSVMDHRTVTGQTHGCEKPLSLLARMIRAYTDPGETVLDPFAGSGTTLRAAKDEGRKAIGIEADERHCAYIAERLAQDVLDFGEAS